MKPNFTILRWSALFEGSSLLLLLFVAMPLKYYAQIHLAVKTLAGLFASFIPFGTFVFKAKFLSN